MITNFVTVYPGHIDFPDYGQNATPANERRFSNEELATVYEKTEAVARKRGLRRMSAQAVGGAVGHNPISIIVPCHRVVGSDGSLTGYAGGLERKVQLLRLEGVDMSRLYVPKKGTAL